MNEEMLFEALAEVGDDLIVMAEQKRFVSPWRKWGQTAAVLAVVACLGVLALPYFPMGCGSSVEKAESTAAVQDTITENTMAAEYAVEEEIEETEECVVEETAAEEYTVHVSDTCEEDAEEFGGKMQGNGGEAQALTKIICRGTYFYLMPEDTVEGVPSLGEELGTITGSDDWSLVGCRVFTVPYSAWFGNHAVNGEPVTQQVYVQTLSGYRYGFTNNEKVVSRYTMEDVRQAIEENNMAWLSDTFVQPIEVAGGVDFFRVSELSSEELNTMFLASTVMNTGTVVVDRWKDEREGTYVVPISDVRWRLDRFLDAGYIYEPEKTGFYDEERKAMVCPVEMIVYNKMNITIHTAQVLDENRLFLLISLPDQKGVTKEYIIRFDGDSWRYETIHETEPDGVLEEEPLP